LRKTDCLVSVVAPIRNDARIIEKFIEEVHAVLSENYTYYEIVLVDDHSQDETGETVKKILARFQCIRMIRLSRSMGFEAAITAGLDSAIGDFVVTMLPDYDPPAAIPEMVDISRRSADIVTGNPTNRPNRGFWFRIFARVFHYLARLLLQADLPTDPNTSFRVLSRRAVNAITRINRKRRFIVVLVSEIGYRETFHHYQLISRSGKKPGLNLMEALSLGVSILVHNSNRPLRFVSLVGIAGSLLSALYSGYVILVNLLKNEVMEGWTTLSLQVSGLFLIAFACLTLLGAYMDRILEEATDRPLYHVLDEVHSSVMMTEETRMNILEESDHPAREEAPPRWPVK
jgi:glycosyltransferase involved in cell wall biosynthesis